MPVFVDFLKNWQNRKGRKPLLLHGAALGKAIALRNRFQFIFKLDKRSNILSLNSCYKILDDPRKITELLDRRRKRALGPFLLVPTRSGPTPHPQYLAPQRPGQNPISHDDLHGRENQTKSHTFFSAGVIDKGFREIMLCWNIAVIARRDNEILSKEIQTSLPLRRATLKASLVA